MIPKKKYVDVQGVRLHYVDWEGDGPPVLLFHGDQRTSRSWDAVARRLHDQFRIIALDARGHGESEWSPRGYKTKDRVYDLIAFMDAVNLSNSMVVAHSTGAGVVAHVALLEPRLINKMFLIETLLVLDVRFQEQASRRETDVRRFWPSQEEFLKYLKWHRATKIWDAEVIADVAAHEVRVVDGGQVESLWAPQTFNFDERKDDLYDLHETLPGCSVPTCFLMSAGRDEKSIDVLRRVSTEMQDASISLFEGVGHNIYMEQPQIVSELIVDFLDGKDLPQKISV